jgi:hypothetical protein
VFILWSSLFWQVLGRCSLLLQGSSTITAIDISKFPLFVTKVRAETVSHHFSIAVFRIRPQVTYCRITWFFYSQTPLQNCLVCPNCLPYNSSARPAKTTLFSLICCFREKFCLPSRSLVAAAYSFFLRICYLATEVVLLPVSRPLSRNE